MRRHSTMRAGRRHRHGCDEEEPDQFGRKTMNTDVYEVINGMVGQPCCRKHIGRMRSLSLGFGGAIPHKTPVGQAIYGEWEVGTYRSAWRIVQRGRILCGSQDVVDSIEDLNLELGRIEIGRFVALRQFTDLDVRVECNDGMFIDFLAAISDDECFHIFCPGQRYVEFTAGSGWKVGVSDKPWTGQSP